MQEFNVSIFDDTLVESTEQIKIFLNVSQEGVLIDTDVDVATVNITDDDSK